jgi:hypothetical protein
MKTDMYNPVNGSHYMASSSQIPILERSGWVVYKDWLAQQGGTSAPAAPADTTSTTPASTDTSASTTPAPTL